MIDEEIN